jgi:glucose-1-phosphate adenylyltransferase
VKNSAPTLYTDSAYIKSSIIADDCVIEGEVENSVIFRGVHVGRGAKIKNSILFHGTTVDCNSNLNSIITDKFVTIGRGVNLSGDLSLPFYIEKKRKI